MGFSKATGPKPVQRSMFIRACLFVVLLLGACGSLPTPTASPPPTTQPTVAFQATPTSPPLPTLTPGPLPTPTLNPNLPWLNNPVFQLINTPYTGNMSADGFNWSQANPIQVDPYNHIFALAQQTGSGNHKFIFSNDAGKSWAENAVEEKYFIRGSTAYDSRNDKIHVLWNATSAKDGIIYRRYDIKRDTQHKITGIARDMSINLQLDFETTGQMSYEHPVLTWLSDKESGSQGRLVAVWSARNEAAPVTNEIRVSQRLLSNSAEDGQPKNWLPFISPASLKAANPTPTTGTASEATPTVPAVTDNPPQVAYSPIFSSSKASIPYVSALYKTTGKHARDFYFFYANGNTTWEWRRAGWNGQANDWSGGLTAPETISKINLAETDGGYDLKQQLGSKPVEDPFNDRVYFGFPTWKDATQGDTWNFVYVEARDTLSEIVNVYSAGKAHSYAPTGDITFDQGSGKIATTYVKTDKGGIYIRFYDGTSPAGAETLLFNAAEGDIPLLWQGGRYEANNRPCLLVLFRTIARPYLGYFGTIEILLPAR